MSIIITTKPKDLISEILIPERLETLMYTGAVCTCGIMKEIDGKLKNDTRGSGLWGENIAAMLTGGQVSRETRKQKDVYMFRLDDNTFVESKVRTLRPRGIQIDPFHEDEVQKVLSGQIRKAIFTLLVDPSNGVLKYIYADDGKKLFDPANNLLANKNQPHRQMIYITDKFKEISNCIYDLDKVSNIQSGIKTFKFS